MTTPIDLDALLKSAPDCGDNSCRFGAKTPGGMRTNGGCRCFERRSVVADPTARYTLAVHAALPALASALREAEKALELYSRDGFIGWLIETLEGRMSDPCKRAREALASLRTRVAISKDGEKA